MASHRKKRTPKLLHTGRNAHLNKFSTSSCWPPQETVAKHLWLSPVSQAACASPPPRTNPQRTWAAAVSHHTHCCCRSNCCWLFCTTPLWQAFVPPHTAASFLGLSPVSRFLSHHPPHTHKRTWAAAVSHHAHCRCSRRRCRRSSRIQTGCCCCWPAANPAAAAAAGGVDGWFAAGGCWVCGVDFHH
jgi:hypothetical protein